ncbi:hypothetical protein FACS189468_0410 [Spirochaetia bacterium]|nr:hypothetical protein FACS189468_0410 [Spirochaetia bacterium]
MAIRVENYMAVLAADLTQWDIKAEAFALFRDRMAARRQRNSACRQPLSV